MQLVIQQIDGPGGPLFCVGNGITHTKPVSLPNPASYPVQGYDNKGLLKELSWYLEHYLEFPVGPDAERAGAVVATLQAWGRSVFDALFTQKAYAWYAEARRDLAALEIKIESNSPVVLSWPWEAMNSSDDGYLAQNCSMSRQPPDLDIPIRKIPEGTDELHILFIVSRPTTENKVGYYALEREIVRYIREEGYAVTIDVLRPPTFDNLRRVLRERPGYYHIVHFDGHGGYGPVQVNSQTAIVSAITGCPVKYEGMEGQLVFETDEMKADLVGAQKLGQLLTQCGVPMMVLNACQSAMIDEQAGDPFASVAARLLKAGIPSVTAMGYSLYVSAAKFFVPAFYEALFHDGGPAGAIRIGRQAMYAHPERSCFYGECSLQDWIVPELYQQVPSGVRLLPSVKRLSSREESFPNELRTIGDYGLIGRGKEIHDLERILQRNRQAGILIHGMAGAGKTTLAKGFLHWLRDTSGLREPDGANCPVFWFNFQDIHNANAVLHTLADSLLDETARTQSAENLVSRLTEALKHKRVFMVWDNFESASGVDGTNIKPFLTDESRQVLKDLLHNLRGGKTRIIITSRHNEAWLSAQECARLETLGGLDRDERWDYCREIVRDLGLTIDQEDPNMKALLERLSGNPLAMRVILLRLGEGKSAKELLNDLGSGFTGTTVDEGTEQIESAFRILCSDLDPVLSSVLQVIGLHVQFTDIYWIASILLNLDDRTNHNSTDMQAIAKDVKRCFQILENAGLCTKEVNTIFRLHPALQGCLSKINPATEDVKRWFVLYMARAVLDPSDDEQKILNQLVCDESNLFYAKAIAEDLKMDEEDLRITRNLALASMGTNYEQAKVLFQEMAGKAKKYGAVLLENSAYDNLSDIAMLFGDREEAKKWSQKATDLWNGDSINCAEAYASLGKNAERQGTIGKTLEAVEYYKKALAIYEQKHDMRAVSLYKSIGDLSERMNHVEEAETWYRKMWQSAKEHNDAISQATAASFLGRISADEHNDCATAISWYQEALRIYQEQNNLHGTAVALSDIGMALSQTEDNLKAKQYLLESSRLAEQLSLTSMLAVNYNALGVIANNDGDRVSARRWFEAALSIWMKEKEWGYVSVAIKNLNVLNHKEGIGGNADDPHLWEITEDGAQLVDLDSLIKDKDNN